MKFLPIINYNPSEDSSLKPELLSILYETSCKVLASNFDEIEISTASYGFWEQLEIILKIPARLAWGSMTSIELAAKLITKLDTNKSYKFFAPAYDQNVAEFLKQYPNIEYIPGIFMREEYKEVSSYASVKIFPYACKDARDMLEILKAPYPELRQAECQSKIVFDLPEASMANIYKISSPRDYQKIRERFLIDPNIKIFIDLNKANCHELAASITKPKYISRININQCTYANAIVSTRVFASLIGELRSGSINVNNLEARMQEEINLIKQCQLA